MECIGCPRTGERKKNPDGPGYLSCKRCDRTEDGLPTLQEQKRLNEERFRRRLERGESEAKYAHNYRVEQGKKAARDFKKRRLLEALNASPPTPVFIPPKEPETVEQQEIVNERDNERYAEWRNAIRRRDRKTCVLCNERDWIQVHHIERWADNQQKRYDLKNGVCLCLVCHQKHHGPQMEPFPQLITDKLLAYIKSKYGA